LKKKKLLTLLSVTVIGIMALLAFVASRAEEGGRNLLPVLIILGGMIISTLLYVVIGRVIGQPGETPDDASAASPELPPVKSPAEKVKIDDADVARTLAFLQSNGRLMDFLLEDIGPYDDAQVGAAVRSIHKDCALAIKAHVKLAPVIDAAEGREVTVESGFDPSAIRLTGNVAGNPPFKGILRHSGWRVVSSSIPSAPKNHDPSVVQQAEVEI
jgi:hypothetical protein